MESASNFSYPDGKQVSKVICISNIKLIFRQLNVNSLRNEFDMLMFDTQCENELLGLLVP